MPAAPLGPPLEAAIDRLAYEAQYVRDVLFLAGPGGTCRVSIPAMQALYDGLGWVLMVLRQQAPPQSPPGGAAVPSPGGS